MEFRLPYRGKLPAQGTKGSRIKEKHDLRRHFHSQLRELWKTHIVLERINRPTGHTRKLLLPDLRDDECQQATGLDFIIRDYSRFGYRLIPLVNSKFGIACALDILFLRRDAPGGLIESGGDIDNRIKVLFDGLRIPREQVEVGELPPAQDESPFFCLLEDDVLITDVKITTDRLLTPMNDGDDIHDIELVIHVTTKILDPQKAWPDFVF